MNNARIAFSYTADEFYTAEPQSIALRCEVVRDGLEAAERVEREQNQEGRQTHVRLCKDTPEAIAAKIDEFVNIMAYQYRSIAGKNATITVSRFDARLTSSKQKDDPDQGDKQKLAP